MTLVSNRKAMSSPHRMRSTVRALQTIATLLLVVALAGRLVGTFAGLDRDRLHDLRLFVVFACGVRTVPILFEVVLGAKPWTRVIVPCAILLALAAAFGAAGLGAFTQIAGVGVELGAFALIGVYLARFASTRSHSGIDGVVAGLERFVPPRLARYMAVESAILCAAIGGMLGRHSPPAEGHRYGNTPVLRWAPLILLVCSPVEIAVVGVLLAALHLKTRIFLIASIGLSLYLSIWLYGVFVTMRRTPHQIAHGNLYVFKGLFKKAVIPLGDLQSAATQPDRPRGRHAGVADLTVAGCPLVRLELHNPVTVWDWLSLSSQSVTTLVISADQPNQLRQALNL